MSVILVLITEYFKVTVIWFESICPVTIKSSTFILGKNKEILLFISSLRKSKLSVVICSKINALNPPPNVGFKGRSPGLVRKKLIKLFLIASWVKKFGVKTEGPLNGRFTPTAAFAFKSIGYICWGLNAIIYYLKVP